jgi:monoterpene epsilon-lactone hydrolase
MASKKSQAVGDLWRSIASRMDANPGLDMVSRRAILDALQELASEPADVTYQEIWVAGQQALWVNPLGAAADRVILFLHGGGFIAGSINCHRKLAAHLAKATGCRALIPAYRLAPENPFPAQLDDAFGIYQWLLKEGLDPSHIATAGDSAGGNLAVSICLRAQAQNLPFPAAIIGISPWLDMEVNGWTLDTNKERSAVGSRESYQQIVGMLLKGHDPKDPFANPLYADLAGFPPIYLSAGTEEALLDNPQRLAEAAKKANVDVTLKIAEGMQHVYEFMAGRAPEADETIADMAIWLRPKIGL